MALPPANAPSTPNRLVVDSIAHNQANLVWWSPNDVVGKIKSYTLILKRSGKVDRVFTVPHALGEIEFQAKVTGLAENTSYAVQMKSNGDSLNGKKKASTSTTSLATKIT